MRWNRSSLVAGMAMMAMVCCLMGCASLGASQSLPAFMYLPQSDYSAPLVTIQITPADGIEVDGLHDPFTDPQYQLERLPIADERPTLAGNTIVSHATYRPAVYLTSSENQSLQPQPQLQPQLQPVPISYQNTARQRGHSVTRVSCNCGCRSKCVEKTNTCGVSRSVSKVKVKPTRSVQRCRCN